MTRKATISRRTEPPSVWVDGIDDAIYDVARVSLAWRRGAGTYRDFWSTACTPTSVETKRGPRAVLDLESPRQTMSSLELAEHAWELGWERFDEIFIESDGRAKEVWVRLRLVNAEGDELYMDGKRIRPSELYAPGAGTSSLHVAVDGGEDESAGVHDRHERGLVRQQALALAQRDALVFKLFDRVDATQERTQAMADRLLQGVDAIMREREVMFRREVERYEDTRDAEIAGATQQRALDLLERLGTQWIAHKSGIRPPNSAGVERPTARDKAAGLNITPDQWEQARAIDADTFDDLRGTVDLAGDPDTDDAAWCERMRTCMNAVGDLGQQRLMPLLGILTAEQFAALNEIRDALKQ